MRVLIVGAGAIGSLLGHRLATAGHAVTLVGRGAWVRAISERGLGLEKEGRLHYQSKLEAVTDSGAVSGVSFDLIICTTKAYDTIEAIRQIEHLNLPDTPVLLLQNGVGGIELAADALPQASLLAGVITLAVEVLSPGAIRLTTTRGGIGLAPASPAASVDDLAITLRRAGFERVKVYADHRAMKWSKLLLNILGNALPTILDVPPEELYAQRRFFALERAAFRETLDVMRGLRLKPVSLPGYPVPLLAWAMTWLPDAVLHPLFLRLVAGGRGGKMPSLHLDLSKGKAKSEVDFLNGAVVKHAQGIKLHVPVNRYIYCTLKAIVSGEIPRAELGGGLQK